MNYTPIQLRILWYLKRNGPLVAKSMAPRHSLGSKIADDLNLSNGTVRHQLALLEKACVILKTYARDIRKKVGDNQGYNALMKIELVDPDMALPPCPPPPPLAVVVAHENRELYERTTTEPTAEAILEALLNRITELQTQIDKLQDIVAAQATQLAQASQRPKPSEHLTARIRDVLPPDQWEKLTHRSES